MKNKVQKTAKKDVKVSQPCGMSWDAFRRSMEACNRASNFQPLSNMSKEDQARHIAYFNNLEKATFEDNQGEPV